MGSLQLRTAALLLPLGLAFAVEPAGRACAQSPAPTQELVQKALAAEAAAASDTSHPVRYRLRKWSPRLTTTKEIVETRDGSVALLVAVNDKPLSAADAAKEQARLNALLADAGKQRHRKQSQDADTARAMKVLRALPSAFQFTYAGNMSASGVAAEKFTFVPDPNFHPPDLETEVLTALTGEIWVDPVHTRVVHLEARLADDVDFGWGILGRLAKGGWISMDQGEVLPGIWRITKFQMNMSGRLLIRTKTFQTTEEESEFVPVRLGMGYRDAIAMLRGSGPAQ